MQDPVWLTLEQPERIHQLLQACGLINESEEIFRLQPAGDGNMNVTLRVGIKERGNSSDSIRSVVVKQSRPFVAKYESIAAPIERIEYEAQFYEFVASRPSLSAMMPRKLAWFPDLHTMVLEDLGTAADATKLYTEHQAEHLPDCVQTLLNWLAELHNSSTDLPNSSTFRNLKLRSLNHAHIFEIPFQDPPAIDLDSVAPGLAKASRAIRTNAALQAKCSELGNVYLSDGGSLLHGDFYPGSWLIADAGPRVIDPEFCFVGPPEFDLGVLTAHLQFCGCKSALKLLTPLLDERYSSLDYRLIEEFSAVEVLRRLLGVAQLPLKAHLEQRLALVTRAVDALVASRYDTGKTA